MTFLRSIISFFLVSVVATGGVAAVVVAAPGVENNIVLGDDDQPPPPPVCVHSKPPLKGQNYNLSRASSGGPPYWGTVYVDGDIINDEDHPSSLEKIETFRDGVQCVRIWNYRTLRYETVDAYIYHVTFSDTVQSQFWVRKSDFGRKGGLKEVIKFAHYLGQVPQFLRRGTNVVSIQSGDDGMGGARYRITLHVDSDLSNSADAGKSREINAEVLVHEGSHTILDYVTFDTQKWNRAVAADGGFISGYAQQYPQQEDVAETILLWIGIRIGSLNDVDRAITQQAIPNRLAYFDDQEFNLYPLGDSENTIDDDYEWHEIEDYHFPCGRWDAGEPIALPVVCKDSSEFRFNDKPTKNCQKFLRKKTKRKCQRKWNGKPVSQWCPSTCSTVGLGPCCKDSMDFRFNNLPKMDCALFLKKKTNERCQREWRGLPVADWCPQTCASVGLGPCADTD
jgi:hypothetical protein